VVRCLKAGSGMASAGACRVRVRIRRLVHWAFILVMTGFKDDCFPVYDFNCNQSPSVVWVLSIYRLLELKHSPALHREIVAFGEIV
jgi:hypothetical protein